MREIKYKVWHKVENRMYWFDLNWGTMYGAGSGWWAVVPWGETRKHHPDNRLHQYLVDPGDCVPLEYTGLKDMHGNEIYEGDILRINGGAEDIFTEVGFEAGCFIAKVPWCDGAKISYPELKYYIGMTFVPIYAVIGNIYENPGLIKEDK